MSREGKESCFKKSCFKNLGSNKKQRQFINFGVATVSLFFAKYLNFQCLNTFLKTNMGKELGYKQLFSWFTARH